MKKYIAVVLSFALTLALASCAMENAVLGEPETYEVTSQIHSLDIEINAADFKLRRADGFSVQSNLKHLSVTENGGVLRIKDRTKSNVSYTDAMLTLYVPEGTEFKDVDIDTGAAKMTVEELSTASMELNLGAGDVHFEKLIASKESEIKGGAGQITVESGSLQDLSLEMGIGELNLNVALLGHSELEMGAGESNLNLSGSKEDYTIRVEKGIGSIRVEEEEMHGFYSSGNGPNHIEIEGGIGAVNIAFREKESAPAGVENVTMGIYDISSAGATVIIKDTNQEPYVYGEWYQLEKEENGQYRAVEPIIENYGFHEMGYIPDKNGEVRFVIDWQWLYGQLPAGNYRLYKQVNSQNIFVDFTIDAPQV